MDAHYRQTPPIKPAFRKYRLVAGGDEDDDDDDDNVGMWDVQPHEESSNMPSNKSQEAPSSSPTHTSERTKEARNNAKAGSAKKRKTKWEEDSDWEAGSSHRSASVPSESESSNVSDAGTGGSQKVQMSEGRVGMASSGEKPLVTSTQEKPRNGEDARQAPRSTNGIGGSGQDQTSKPVLNFDGRSGTWKKPKFLIRYFNFIHILTYLAV